MELAGHRFEASLDSPQDDLWALSCMEILQVEVKGREGAGSGFRGEKAEAEIMISVRKTYSAWECEVSW